MATLSAGYSFGATETCTNTKLGQLVSNGSVSNITQTDIAAGEGLVYVGTSAPSDTDRVWVDTNSTPVILRFYNSNLSAWVTSDNLAVYTNKSAQTGAAGRVVIFDTSNSNSYTYTSTTGDTKFLGIETGSIAANASAPLVSRGSVVTNLELSASAGCYLRTSSATGKAEPCVNTAAGVFGFLTEAGTASARAHIFGIDPNGTLDQTANYTWTGTHTFNGTLAITTASASTTNWAPIVQIVNTQTGASASGSTTMPGDDTIPQNTEGDQYMTLAITPKHAANKLKIDVVFNYASNGSTWTTLGLFQDTTANALAATSQYISQVDKLSQLVLTHYMAAGTTSSTTFKVRVGDSAGGTVTFNGLSGARKLGGVMASSITITEIKV